MNIFETLCVPSIFRNLVSLSKLDKVEYSFRFDYGSFSLYKHTNMAGNGILYDGLYNLNLDTPYSKTLLTLHCNVITEHCLVNECFAYLWH